MVSPHRCHSLELHSAQIHMEEKQKEGAQRNNNHTQPRQQPITAAAAVFAFATAFAAIAAAVAALATARFCSCFVALLDFISALRTGEGCWNGPRRIHHKVDSSKVQTFEGGQPDHDQTCATLAKARKEWWMECT